MKVTLQINIQRLKLSELLKLLLITSMWNLVAVSISRLLVLCTNCAPLVADLFLYSYEADFVQHLQKIVQEAKNIL